ncbi:MAG: transcription elongation factor GreA [Candidatus Jacksonbacteria bacterium RIFCSPLOWO2_02_FULL_43_9]|nr:MAG: Transcription elongation factor GreA [Parcubacteria group bacterium GW2011_GWA2_43_13]OGY69330.1 MAG: transcription elongation factor GreA [Candidatus Jacksonbacteria bacterium RIFCSPHIGHO2_02_FULL_43_10]OGY71213.1 MAG: transcription elongation factor GreA [Candidatus Jacksonbacteria bacterium RIFCSPLOWO2_01_FULL_44_13]OGY71913.1 MAG: transcription elongation factor GreA [Candidatus Jacksonbacteria bacterium RIFCSPLOWO2_02_FULL_43_9]HAZ16809.1 transcription elongation factor GreA [Candi
MSPTYVTKEGYASLTKELEDLKKNKRREVAQKIKEAKELGDLSENAEYSAAKDEQAFVESRIAELEAMLQDVQIIRSSDNKKKEAVVVGSTVRLKMGDQELSYTIVGSSEADPLNGKVSNESPLGKSFLGKKVGDEVSVLVPVGTITYHILEIL